MKTAPQQMKQILRELTTTSSKSPLGFPIFLKMDVVAHLFRAGHDQPCDRSIALFLIRKLPERYRRIVAPPDRQSFRRHVAGKASLKIYPSCPPTAAPFPRLAMDGWSEVIKIESADRR